jgi:uncharacterized protein YkwD
MVQKHIVISMIAPIAVAGILIMTILTATANAQESNNTGNLQQPVAGCGPGTDNSTCSTTPNTQAPAAPTTAGCGPGTDNSTCSTTPNTQAPAAAPTAGCGPGTDNSTCKATTPSLQPTNITKPTNVTRNLYCETCNNDIYSGNLDFANMILAVHNRERAAVGVPPLVWSDKLAADAKLYAEHLVATGEFDHPSDKWVAAHPTGPEGENLAGNHRLPPVSSPPPPPSSIARMEQGWIAEKNYYQGYPSATGDTTTGHYTQMVWRDTTQVGCGYASAGGYDVLSCRYSPPGNIIGQKPY